MELSGLLLPHQSHHCSMVGRGQSASMAHSLPAGGNSAVLIAVGRKQAMYWQSGGQPVNRREFIMLTGASVAWPFAAMAQEPGRTYRLGVLFAAPRSDDASSAFFEGVRPQGFIEGQNLTVIYHAFGMNPDLLPECCRAGQSPRRCHRNCREFGNPRRTGGDKNNSDPCKNDKTMWSGRV